MESEKAQSICITRTSNEVEGPPGQAYCSFIGVIARKLPRFKPLDVFLRLYTQDHTASISTISFWEYALPAEPATLDECGLEENLKEQKHYELIIVENITQNYGSIGRLLWT